jgi:hypothetical protein
MPFSNHQLSCLGVLSCQQEQLWSFECHTLPQAVANFECRGAVAEQCTMQSTLLSAQQLSCFLPVIPVRSCLAVAASPRPCHNSMVHLGVHSCRGQTDCCALPDCSKGELRLSRHLASRTLGCMPGTLHVECVRPVLLLLCVTGASVKQQQEIKVGERTTFKASIRSSAWTFMWQCVQQASWAWPCQNIER